MATRTPLSWAGRTQGSHCPVGHCHGGQADRCFLQNHCSRTSPGAPPPPHGPSSTDTEAPCSSRGQGLDQGWLLYPLGLSHAPAWPPRGRIPRKMLSPPLPSLTIDSTEVGEASPPFPALPEGSCPARVSAVSSGACVGSGHSMLPGVISTEESLVFKTVYNLAFRE